MSVTTSYTAFTSSKAPLVASVHTNKNKAPSCSHEPSVAASEQWKTRCDERTLVRCAMRGDLQAQEMLFGRYRSRLYRLALRLLHTKEDAEDAVQDALLSAYRNLATFEGRSLFSTWLTRIVVNAALVRIRRQRARPEMFLQDIANDEHASSLVTFVDSRPDPEQAYASTETRDLVKDALRDLSPSIRFAFQLRELQDLSNAEGAEVAGIQVGAFKSRISRARSQLAERFSPATIAPLQKPFTTPVTPLRRLMQEDSAASCVV
jgi:RNA polymerase sigma-70 factor, ECF subfamily